MVRTRSAKINKRVISVSTQTEIANSAKIKESYVILTKMNFDRSKQDTRFDCESHFDSTNSAISTETTQAQLCTVSQVPQNYTSFIDFITRKDDINSTTATEPICRGSSNKIERRQCNVFNFVSERKKSQSHLDVGFIKPGPKCYKLKIAGKRRVQCVPVMLGSESPNRSDNCRSLETILERDTEYEVRSLLEPNVIQMDDGNEVALELLREESIVNESEYVCGGLECGMLMSDEGALSHGTTSEQGCSSSSSTNKEMPLENDFQLITSKPPVSPTCSQKDEFSQKITLGESSKVTDDPEEEDEEEGHINCNELSSVERLNDQSRRSRYMSIDMGKSSYNGSNRFEFGGFSRKKMPKKDTQYNRSRDRRQVLISAQTVYIHNHFY